MEQSLNSAPTSLQERNSHLLRYAESSDEFDRSQDMNVTSTNEERSKSQSVKVQFSNLQFINDRQERSSLSRYSPLNLQPEISLSVRFAVRLTSLRSHNGRSCILFTAFLLVVRKIKIIRKLLCYNCL